MTTGVIREGVSRMGGISMGYSIAIELGYPRHLFGAIWTIAVDRHRECVAQVVQPMRTRERDGSPTKFQRDRSPNLPT